MRNVVLGGLLALVLAGCSPAFVTLPSAMPLSSPLSAASAPLKSGVPHYRVFRGVKRADVAYGAFVKDLSQRFIPAAPKTHAKNGLVAYLPGLPPEQKPAGIADEFAIVVYESADVYQKARNSAEGQAYSDLHWELFDKAASKSTSAVTLESTGNQLTADTGYDLMQTATDWQKGHSTLFVGSRKPEVRQGDFLGRLTQHVQHTRSAFKNRGLNGYIVVATPDQNVVYMNWDSQAAANKAFASKEGQEIVGESQALVRTVQVTNAQTFAGKIQGGQLVNVPFQKR